MVQSVISTGLVLVYLCTSVTSDRNCTSVFCLLSLPINMKNSLNNTEPIIPIEIYIRQFGYPVESHDITTQDGYILRYHRIPQGKSPTVNSTRRIPVLVQHGLFAASPVWVMSAKALGYSLADAGFDVWLGNARGNTYSRKHIKYDPDKDKQEFWDFSWHEMGYYDLPASIDYILNITKSDYLFYIGHSMGTTMYFVLGATRPEYMDKIKAMVAMAPVAFPWNIRSPLLKVINYLHTFLNWLSKIFKIYEMFEYSNIFFWLDQNICGRQHLQFICRDILFLIGGFDEQELNRTSLSTILEYIPAGSSYKELKHYSQIQIKGSEFKQFDYGYMGNLARYGSFTPPSYNLTYVKAPMYVYYGMNDWLAVPEDVYYTVGHLPNVKDVIKVSNDKFNHLDFMWAIDAKTLVYDDVISIFQKLLYYQ